MPTIILLDSSLSMSRPVSMPDSNEDHNRRNLAVHGINTFLDYMADKCKLEFVSLVEFSSQAVVQEPFTREYSTIKNSLLKTDESMGNKTCLEAALNSVKFLVMEEWGIHNSCQILLVTDGCTGIGQGSLKESLNALANGSQDKSQFPLPFPFKCKLHILCIASHEDRYLQLSLPLYKRLINIGGVGEVFVPEGQLHIRTVQAMFTKMSEKHFMPFHGMLKCGNLKCPIQLFPSPESYEKNHEFDHIEKSVSRVIEVCAFLDINDIASPSFISRHLVLPISAETGEAVKEEEEGDGKHAAFTVLLHGSLKVEGMVALTQLADDWFGMIYSWADSKKKSNLMLSVFEPGVDILPWLGNLTQLAPTEDFQIDPYEDDKSPFPIRPSERRSYAQNCVVWLKQTGIQADIQKILRNARKLPEKQQQFYKELNRLRRAALAYGFHNLLDAVAQLLERECTMLPGNAHPDAALQLTHAANALKHERVRDVVHNVLPLVTNFTGD